MPIYQLNYRLMMGCTAWEASEEVGIEGAFNEDRMGSILLTNTGNIYVWVRDSEDIPTMVHECVHAANAVFMVSGVKCTASNDEALAYLVEWFFCRMMELRDSKPRRRA